MQVRVGDRVRMQDGSIVNVTDAAFNDPREYILEDPDAEKIMTFPPETIFIGKTDGGRTVVSDSSLVVSILE